MIYCIHSFIWDVTTLPCSNFNRSLTVPPSKLTHGSETKSHSFCKVISMVTYHINKLGGITVITQSSYELLCRTWIYILWCETGMCLNDVTSTKVHFKVQLYMWGITHMFTSILHPIIIYMVHALPYHGFVLVDLTHKIHRFLKTWQDIQFAMLSQGLTLKMASYIWFDGNDKIKYI